MSKLAIITAHAGADSLTDAVSSWIQYEMPPEGFALPFKVGNYVSRVYDDMWIHIVDGQEGMLKAYQRGFEEENSGADIIAYLHDDLLLMDPDWIPRVLAEFEDPKVGLVGFGGSQTHGSRDLYRAPYHISQLSRGKFLSNMLDAEVHGFKYEGPPIDVSALDGFALIFRRSALEASGGWPVENLSFHGYDFWATAITHRLGYRVRLVPVKCLHLGGRTSVVKKLDPVGSHESGHRWIYSEFSDVLPWVCQ